MHFVDANGAKIPAIGLGTWEWRGRTCARLVEQALRLGYRHIDTAQAYENEREVGEGLRTSGVRRDDVFVTTKVWTTHFAPHDLERSTKESLAKLRLSEVDLLLLHWPNPQVPLQETLGALARVKKLGMARHIGVSAFTVALIHEAGADRADPRQARGAGLPALAGAAERFRDTADLKDRTAVGKYRHLRLRAVRRRNVPDLPDAKRQGPAYRFRFCAEMGLRLLHCPLCWRPGHDPEKWEAVFRKDHAQTKR